nr:MAG TPA: hypothetical protein [Caudoviricetes sp.]
MDVILYLLCLGVKFNLIIASAFICLDRIKHRAQQYQFILCHS